MEPIRYMNVIVLAAGYGTRLGAIGRERPKGLLERGGKPLLDHFPAKVNELPGSPDLYIVTNQRSSKALRLWADGARGSLGLVPAILDDGTSRPEERLGAVGDLSLVDHAGQDTDALVLATDTLFDFSFADFVREFDRRAEAEVLLAIQEENDRRVLRRRGVVSLTPQGWVNQFQEKPEAPSFALTALPIYLLRVVVLPLVEEFMQTGRDPDAPGHLIKWLVDRVRVAG